MAVHRRRAAHVGLLLALSAPLAAQRPLGFAEGQDAIVALLLQYDPELAGEVFPSWRDLAASLPPEVELVVAAADAPQARAARALAEHAGFASSRVDVLQIGAVPTVWARDRALFLRRDGRASVTTPSIDDVEDDRRGDLSVAAAIAARFDHFVMTRSATIFEGGDLLFTGGRPIAGAGLLLANLDDPDAPDAPVIAELTTLLGGEPILCGARLGVPHAIGDRHVLLGDPRLGAALLERLRGEDLTASVLPPGDDFSIASQLELAARYDAIREELEQAGLLVDRLPIVHGDQGLVLTWNNALIDAREDGVRAYVPSYGIPALDRAAHDVFRGLGLRCFPIDVARLLDQGGAVRCMTNVIRWRTVLPLPAAPKPR